MSVSINKGQSPVGHPDTTSALRSSWPNTKDAEMRGEATDLASPSEGAVFCPDKGNIDALGRLLEEIPEGEGLIALIHFCYAIQIKIPCQLPAQCGLFEGMGGTMTAFPRLQL